MKCKNCRTEISEQDDYCKSCGGKVIRNRLSFKNLFDHLSETFFNYDNKLLRTFVQLFKQPEDVIVGYINGVRKKYINPISFFGLALTLSGLSILIIKKFYIEYLDFSVILEGTNVPDEILKNISSESLEYNSLFYSILVPLFALISWVTFLDKKYNFTEHNIIYLYTMSLLNILLVVLAQLALLIAPTYYLIFSIFSYPLMFIYNCYVLNRIFQLSIFQLILRSMVALFLFFLSYIGITLIVFSVMILTGQINIEDFAPK